MDLKQKIQLVLDKYNNGKFNPYAAKMLEIIHWEEFPEKRENNYYIFLNDNEVSYMDYPDTYSWSIYELIGICITDNEDIFK